MLDSTCINQVTQEHALNIASPRYRSGFCNVVSIQRLSLTFSDISDRISEFFLAPKISFATAVRPRTAITSPAIALAHFSCGVSLKCGYHAVRCTIGGDNNVNVIRPNVDNPQRP